MVGDRTFFFWAVYLINEVGEAWLEELQYVNSWVGAHGTSTARRTEIATRGIGSSRRRRSRARARTRTRYPRASIREPPFRPRREHDASEGGTRAQPRDAQALLFQRVLPVGRRRRCREGRRGRGGRRRRCRRHRGGGTVCGTLMHGARWREVQTA